MAVTLGICFRLTLKKKKHYLLQASLDSTHSVQKTELFYIGPLLLKEEYIQLSLSALYCVCTTLCSDGAKKEENFFLLTLTRSLSSALRLSLTPFFRPFRLSAKGGPFLKQFSSDPCTATELQGTSTTHVYMCGPTVNTCTAGLQSPMHHMQTKTSS